MENLFFERPILNSPYERPQQHWELDHQGQPTQQIIPRRRVAEFITPIPKPRKRKEGQLSLVYNEGKGLSTQKQQYDPTPIINELRVHVDQWRNWPNPKDWQITPETTRLLLCATLRRVARGMGRRTVQPLRLQPHLRRCAGDGA
jgi:type III restriction enzyme